MAGGVARRRRGRADERGAAAVEFALVVPLLLLIVFGVISYGYLLSFRQGLSQAAAKAARAAAVSGADTEAEKVSAARDAVGDALDFYGVSCASNDDLVKGGVTVGDCVVTVAACSSGDADCVTVDVEYWYDDHPLLPDFPFVPLPEQLGYSAVARVS